MMTLRHEFKVTKEGFEKALALTFQQWEGPSTLKEAIRYSLFAESKRLRPLLCLIISDILGGAQKITMPAAIAIELVHTYSLIHDDLPSMDNATTRRGKSSCHVQFGEAMAILAGDALLTQAFNLLSNPEWPLDSLAKLFIIQELSEAGGLSGMVGGQIRDIEFQSKPANPPSLEETIDINRHKTAKLFEAACVIGGICAKAGASILSSLKSYGENLGLAFQASDDMLDSDLRSTSRTDMKVMIQKWIHDGKGSIDRLKIPEGAILNDVADWIQNRIQ